MFLQQMAVGALIGLHVPDVTVTAVNLSGAALAVTQHAMFGFTSAATSVVTGSRSSCWASAVKVPAATPTFPLTDGLRQGWSMICKSINGVDKSLTAIGQNVEFVGLIQGVVTASVRGLDVSTAVPQYAVFWPVANQTYLATGLTGNRPAAGTQYKGQGMVGWTTPGSLTTEQKSILFSGIVPLGVE